MKPMTFTRLKALCLFLEVLTLVFPLIWIIYGRILSKLVDTTRLCGLCGYCKYFPLYLSCPTYNAVSHRSSFIVDD